MQAITLSHQLYKARQLEESLAVAEKAVTCARNIHGEVTFLQLRYAMSGTDTRYAATRQITWTWLR